MDEISNTGYITVFIRDSSMAFPEDRLHASVSSGSSEGEDDQDQPLLTDYKKRATIGTFGLSSSFLLPRSRQFRKRSPCI
jgi:hypothetical protein